MSTHTFSLKLNVFGKVNFSRIFYQKINCTGLLLHLQLDLIFGLFLTSH